MDGWITSFLLGWHLFRCYVIFRVDHQSVSSCCPSIMLYQLFINQLFILFHVFLALEVGEAFRRSVYDPAWRRLRLGPIKISPSTMRGFVIPTSPMNVYTITCHHCTFKVFLMYHEAPIEIVVPYSTNKVCPVAFESHPKNDTKTRYLYVPSANVAGTMLIQQLPKLVHQQSWDLRPEMIGPLRLVEFGG